MSMMVQDYQRVALKGNLEGELPWSRKDGNRKPIELEQNN